MSLDRGEGEEAIQSQERFVFQGLSASGYARQHNGNVYNNYAYNYTVRKRKSDETLQEDQRNKQFLKAAAAGHTPRVRYLMNLGADLDFSLDDGYTALHHAALSGFEDTVECLLIGGADVAAASVEYGTPLHLAALKGRVNVARLLLKYRTDPNASSDSAGYPLHCACIGASAQVVSELLQQQGVRASQVGTVNFRLFFPTVNLGWQEWMAHCWDCQPLFAAVCPGCPEVINLLIDAGAATQSTAQRRPIEFDPLLASRKPLPEEPSMTAQSGFSPLSLSIIRDMPEVTELLLKRGTSEASIAQLLYEAASAGRNRCLGVLMQRTPILDLADEPNGTPLMGAACGGHVDTARLLIEAGASVNFATSHTALHCAIIFAHPNMVSSLLNWGADPELCNGQGRNAMELTTIKLGANPRSKEFLSIRDILDSRPTHTTECRRPIITALPGEAFSDDVASGNVFSVQRAERYPGKHK